MMGWFGNGNTYGGHGKVSYKHQGPPSLYVQTSGPTKQTSHQMLARFCVAKIRKRIGRPPVLFRVIGSSKPASETVGEARCTRGEHSVDWKFQPPPPSPRTTFSIDDVFSPN